MFFTLSSAFKKMCQISIRCIFSLGGNAQVSDLVHFLRVEKLCKIQPPFNLELYSTLLWKMKIMILNKWTYVKKQVLFCPYNSQIDISSSNHCEMPLRKAFLLLWQISKCQNMWIYLVFIYHSMATANLWVRSSWQIPPQHQITYPGGPELASMEIPPFRPFLWSKF